MCLYLKNEEVEVKTAKKDIAVYKILKENKDFLIKVDKLKELKHGDSFKGIINKTECEGKVSIDFIGRIFFCTNEEKLNGNRTSDRFGYKYSWIKDTNLISKIIVNDEIIFEKIYLYRHRLRVPHRLRRKDRRSRQECRQGNRRPRHNRRHRSRRSDQGRRHRSRRQD